MAGQVGGRGFSLHAEGERVILTDAGGQRREVELGRPAGEAPAAVPEPAGPAVVVAGEAAAGAADGVGPPAAPGASPLDAELARLRDAGVLGEEGGAS